jgi:hypothetical protein
MNDLDVWITDEIWINDAGDGDFDVWITDEIWFRYLAEADDSGAPSEGAGSIILEGMTSMSDGVALDSMFIRPASDAYHSGWMTHEGGTGTLYQQVNEQVPDDANYIRTDPDTITPSVVFKLEGADDPETSLAHCIRYRYGKEPEDAHQQINLWVSIHQGGTFPDMPGFIIADWFHENIPIEWTDAEHLLTETQANNITDYADLYLQFQAEALNGD